MPRRFRKLLLALSIGAVLAVAAAPRLSAMSAPPDVVLPAGDTPYSPTEVLVRFRPGASDRAIAQTLAAEGAAPQANLALAKLGYTLLAVPEGQVIETLIALSRDPAVEKAEPNYILSVADGGQPERKLADTIPADPSWGLQYGPAHIQGPQVWDILTGTKSVVIAIIDTGVDLGHPDLAAKIWHNPGEMGLDGSNNDKAQNNIDDDGNGYVDDWQGWDFTSAAPGDNNPQDQHGHGTHVAGIAAATTNNGVGMAGMNWQSPLLAVRVLNASGNGSDAQVISGIVYATDQGAKVINLSLGALSTSQGAALEAAVNYAYNHGVLVVAAAGNYGAQGVIYPARYSHALAVAATNSSDGHPSFSSFGPEVDVAAPGDVIYSTCYISATVACPGAPYGYLSGTSMAAPHVAGVAALLAALPQFNTPDKLRVALESTAMDLGDPRWDQYYGYGLIQAYSAAVFDANTATPTPTPSPTPPPISYAVYSSDDCATGAAFTWESATGGTNLGLHADDGSTALTLPFAFELNGEAKTSALVSTNGYLTFGSTGSAFANASIPNSNQPNDYVAPLWDDLDLRSQGAVYALTLGSAPERRLVVEWNGVKHYNTSSTLTFQAVLEEGTNNIWFRYDTLTAASASYANGGQATVGIEFAGGANGVQYSYNNASLHPGLALLFSPEGNAAPVCGATPTPAARILLPLIEN